jgi:hypothetical protein
VKIISTQECEEWLAANFDANAAISTIETSFSCSTSYGLPSDAGRKIALARLLSASNSVFDTSRPILFWITGWGIFPSCENQFLFYAFRQSLGESRELAQAPGHLIREDDLLNFECLLDLSLLFYWDSVICESSGGVAIRCDNNEQLTVFAKTGERMRQTVWRLASFQLEQIS